MSIHEIARAVAGLTDQTEILARLREMSVNSADIAAALKSKGVSFSKVGLEPGLKAMGYELTGKVTLYTVKDSQHVRREKVIEGIRFLDYCPIMSPNREHGLLQFTIVPYRKPDTFEETKCESRKMTPKELWRLVESVRSLAAEDKSPLGIQKALAIADETATTGSHSSLLVDYALETSAPGRALDLGCGPGVNTAFLLQRKWIVTAVDYNAKVLDLFRKICGKDSDKLTFKKANITTAEFPANSYELVICAEVLQYIPPSTLRSVLEKIHAALVPNGVFIGTLYFHSPDAEAFIERSMRKERVYFYPGSFMVPSLLEASGFRVVQCPFKPLPEHPLTPKSPVCAEFLAIKVSK